MQFIAEKPCTWSIAMGGFNFLAEGAQTDKGLNLCLSLAAQLLKLTSTNSGL